MPSVHETLSEQFYRWERRGRGWQVFDHPVTPEPPFVPFAFAQPEPVVDDGRRPTVLSSLVQKFSRKLSGGPEAPPVIHEPEEEPEPEPESLERSALVELQISLPRQAEAPDHVFGQFLQSVFPCDEPFSFELLGLSNRTALQLALAPTDSLRVRKQIAAFFPEISVVDSTDMLATGWKESDQGGTAGIEFGLSREFRVPLLTPSPAPQRLNPGLLLGHSTHGGRTVEVRLSPEQRVRHIQISGASGTGKTTLLYNLIRQDVENGQGLALLDPHGDLVDRVLGIIPKERLADVVLVDPADEQYSVAFNILSAHSDLEKHLLASDLVSVFKRLSSSWGDQMGSVLQNAILAFLESSRRGALADLRRFLIEPAFRVDFLKSVEDSEVLYYWHKAFPQLTGNKSIGPVLTRLETFLAPKPIRYMVSQPVNRLDFADIMDTGKIFLAKLSEGLLGKENSYLLGALLVAKFQQLAMSRQAQQMTMRKDFWLYLDEFQNFITPSLAEILTGARKYRLGLVLAHHELRQLERDKEVASAVLSNCYTRVVFRVGDDDARKLAEGVASFEDRDLQNLAIGQAICRVERSDFDFNLAIPLLTEPNPADAGERRREVITASREKYATPRAQVEAVLRKQTHPAEQQPPPSTPPPRAEQCREAPPPSEPPKITRSEKEQVETGKSKPEAPRDLGRGGAQHKAIQQRVKEEAENAGFRGVIEKEILQGQGSVDLLLERSGQVIACEIAITTTIDHEVGNIAKCLKAGFPNVAIICVEEERLKKIAAAVSGSLGSEAGANVQYYLPDEFIARLRVLPPPVAKTQDASASRRGYKIKRSGTNLTSEERNRREDAAIKSIAEVMRQEAR